MFFEEGDDWFAALGAERLTTGITDAHRYLLVAVFDLFFANIAFIDEHRRFSKLIKYIQDKPRQDACQILKFPRQSA